MMLTAAVASFLAVATQAPFGATVFFSIVFIHIFLIFLALSYPARRNSFLAINYSILNCFFVPTGILFLFLSSNFGETKLPLVLWFASIFVSVAFATGLLRKDSRFDKMSGGISLLINVLPFLIVMYLLH